MGRTLRIRKRRRRADLPKNSTSLDHEKSTVNLRKYMAKHGCKRDGASLELRSFPDTGRGLAAKTKIERNDILISVPYDLMVTYDCLQYLRDHLKPHPMLEIQDLLTLFLLVEKCKRGASQWSYYINSLPKHPPHLPWLRLPPHQIDLLPVDLCDTAKSRRRVFERCWWRLRRSIRRGGDVERCVLDPHKFKWAYVLVNTRAVYVDPCLVRADPGSLLSDEPSMALCPFLDLFNHSHTANTEAQLTQDDSGSLIYRLITRTPFKKNAQVFISYGAHDNPKLIMEYGFFIPGNDVIDICAGEALRILQLKPSKEQYVFLRNRGLDEDLYVTETGPSFNLKAFLYVTTNNDNVDYNAVVFSDSYPEQFEKESKKSIQKLLLYKLVNGPITFGVEMPLLVAYFNSRTEYIKSLLVEAIVT